MDVRDIQTIDYLIDSCGIDQVLEAVMSCCEERATEGFGDDAAYWGEYAAELDGVLKR